MPHTYTALITGASAGLGKIFAEQLAADGYNLIITARRKDRLDQIAADIQKSHGVEVESIEADLTMKDDIRLIEDKIRATDSLALLVNNAGYGVPGSFQDLDIRANLVVVTVLIEATKRFCRAALPKMIDRKHGAIINVSSVASFLPSPKGATYAASKAYLTMFSECLDMDVSRFGVRVQALCPGFTRTEFHKAAGYGQDELSKIPNWLWLEADFVVKESLEALKKNKCIVVPSLRYKFILFLFRLPLINRMIRNSIRKRRD